MSVVLHLVRAVVLVLILSGCSKAEREHVVLYTSQDQFYAEPIIKEFTAATGIEVRPVFDTESAKTAGLAHRLRAERWNPRCDVFWSNEELHTRLLERAGLVNGDWIAAGSRTRRLVVNTNMVLASRVPKSLLELTNNSWNGRVAIAYPLFGTTKSHFLALRQAWGEELWKDWCYGLVRNGAKIVDGNSVVVKLVGSGECAIGLTDSDDIAAGLRQGLPISGFGSEGEYIAIPSTIALVRDAPHRTAARKLIDYLSGTNTLARLVSIGALESTSARPEDPGLLTVDWAEALKNAQDSSNFLELIFIRS